MISNLDVRLFRFDAFGKGQIKKMRVSPDAFIQQAVQLAFYRCVHIARLNCHVCNKTSVSVTHSTSQHNFTVTQFQTWLTILTVSLYSLFIIIIPNLDMHLNALMSCHYNYMNV